MDRVRCKLSCRWRFMFVGLVRWWWQNLFLGNFNLLMIFHLFWIYFRFAVNIFLGEHCFYVINHHCLIDYKNHISDNSLIHWNNLLSVLLLLLSLCCCNFQSIKGQDLFLKVAWGDFCPTFFQITVLWGFSFDISSIGCWPIFSLWLSQH